MILNIGSGERKLEDCINIDCEASLSPDLVCDVRKEPLPYEDSSVDEIWMIHSLEHIEMYYWEKIFKEFARVLKPNGILLLAYPEFKECSKRFLSDSGGQRGFWRSTLYGRQLYPSDYHVVPMHSPEIKDILETYKFYRVAYGPESEHEPHNTVLVARRNPEHITREEQIVKELHLVDAIRK